MAQKYSTGVYGIGCLEYMIITVGLLSDLGGLDAFQESEDT